MYGSQKSEPFTCFNLDFRIKLETSENWCKNGV